MFRLRTWPGVRPQASPSRPILVEWLRCLPVRLLEAANRCPRDPAAPESGRWRAILRLSPAGSLGRRDSDRRRGRSGSAHPAEASGRRSCVTSPSLIGRTGGHRNRPRSPDARPPGTVRPRRTRPPGYLGRERTGRAACRRLFAVSALCGWSGLAATDQPELAAGLAGARPDHCGLSGSLIAVRTTAGLPIPRLIVSSSEGTGVTATGAGAARILL